MPWREKGPARKRDPYRVWIAEVMLQQTRVDQARPYFEHFVDAFPTVESLAKAELDAVLKCWEGLGYYSRARNLHRAAKQIVEEFGGRIPHDETAIRSLPGIGPYTAAAVLSIAFDKPLAVLDGNVIRVLSRVLTVENDVRSSATKRALRAVADALLDTHRPGIFNEAVMELGATICTPKAPACERCPLRSECAAFAGGNPEAFPVASKKKPIPHYEIAVGVVADATGCVLIQKRPEDAMLGGLWEFPGGKREAGESLEETCCRELEEELGIEVEIGGEITQIKHVYSHFSITLHAFDCVLTGGEPVHHADQPIRWVSLEKLNELAFPRATGKLIEVLLDRKKNETPRRGVST
ncbi:MAG: A/G-specific adenine glycosylase [Bacteroidetes bacterium]|nr:A/G-specific adenine glycosylase [Bacteroidota bacterium]